MAIKAHNAEFARASCDAEIERRSRDWFPQAAASRGRSQRTQLQRQEQKSRAAEAAALQRCNPENVESVVSVFVESTMAGNKAEAADAGPKADQSKCNRVCVPIAVMYPHQFP